MALKLRLDVYVHLDMPGVQEVAALTQQLRARNDALAQVVAEIGGQNGVLNVSTTPARGDFIVGTGNVQQVIENLRAEVERNSSVDAGASTLIQTLAARIEEQKNDPTALQALVDQLRGSTDSLAAAVSANTPAEEGTGGG